MTDKLPVNLGYVYENMVAQMLRAKGDNLFYHTFYKDGSTHPYEVDFLISRDNKLCPIEVKSSSNTTHTSLDMFYTKYSSQLNYPGAEPPEIPASTVELRYRSCP